MGTSGSSAKGHAGLIAGLCFHTGRKEMWELTPFRAPRPLKEEMGLAEGRVGRSLGNKRPTTAHWARTRGTGRVFQMWETQSASLEQLTVPHLD